MSGNEPKPGAYTQATAATIADGEFRDAIDETILEVFKALEEHEKVSQSTTGSAEGTIKFKVTRNSKELFNFEFETGVKRPKIKTLSLVRAGSGRPLVSINPEDDADLNDKRQMKLPTYDRFGNPKAVVNKETGEVEPSESAGGVAGRIEKQA